MSKSLFPFYSPRLPLEVCEAIISFVDEDIYDYGRPWRAEVTRITLYSCALVSRFWFKRARFHLFRDVLISHRSASNFVVVATTYPMLGSYVQRVELSGYPKSVSTTSTIPKDHEWIYHFFNKAVPLLPNLTSIRYNFLPTLHPRFYILPPRVPSLTSLSLSFVDATSVGDVLRFISYYKCLKELYVYEGTWGQFSNHHYHFGQRWSCNLRVLSIGRLTVRDVLNMFHWLAQLRTSCSFEHLLLQWGYDDDDHPIDLKPGPVRPVPENITLEWARTLKTLSLDFMDNDVDPPYVSTLISKLVKTCSHLHTIRLEMDSDRYGVLEQLPDVLPALESLQQFAFCIGESFEQTIQYEEDLELWKAVDRIFAEPEKLSKMEYFEVMWYIDGTLKEQEKGETSTVGDGESTSGHLGVGVDLLKGRFADWNQTKLLTSIFPCLSARGILWFSLAELGRMKGGGSFYALKIAPEISSPSWSPLYRNSLLNDNWHPEY